MEKIKKNQKNFCKRIEDYIKTHKEVYYSDYYNGLNYNIFTKEIIKYYQEQKVNKDVDISSYRLGKEHIREEKEQLESSNRNKRDNYVNDDVNNDSVVNNIYCFVQD